MVPHGTGIPVLALALRHTLMIAASLPQTGIGGAFVLIIAKINIAAFYRVGFVHLTVAIVVKPVAGFSTSDPRITSGQSTPGADPFSDTQTVLVLYLARCPETQLYRSFRARAHASISHALQRADPIDRDCR